MKKLIFLPVLMLFFFNTSCTKDEDGEEIDASFVGNWSGTYSGDDRGIWTVNVSATGKVTGTATSSFTSDSADINGHITENGALSATIGSSEARTFVGQLIDNEQASGT
ncbi:hypothetical protein [Maribacter sp. IgM3_T14_3]|uniref:hypothetical protein n=1 Tax=Maribacter sp. IgM3_T14_3 TaxID=3415140 RepID=UPI003C6FCB4B